MWDETFSYSPTFQNLMYITRMHTFLRSLVNSIKLKAERGLETINKICMYEKYCSTVTRIVYISRHKYLWPPKFYMALSDVKS